MASLNENDTRSRVDEEWETPSIEWLKINTILGGNTSDDEGATTRTS